MYVHVCSVDNSQCPGVFLDMFVCDAHVNDANCEVGFGYADG